MDLEPQGPKMDEGTAEATGSSIPQKRIVPDTTSGQSRIGLPEPEYLRLGDAQEDIIEGDAATTSPEKGPAFAPDVGQSLPSDKVYIQEGAGFRKALRQRFEKSAAERARRADAAAGEDNEELELTTHEGIRTSIACQTVFRRVAITLQGLLAGFTIAHCLVVISHTPPYFPPSQFVHLYAPLALPGHCLYYVVLVICTVAALDRYDLGQSFPRVVYRAVTFQSGGLCVLFYLGAVVVNEVPMSVDERMMLYFTNATAPTGRRADMMDQISEEAWMSSDVSLWRACLIAKAVLVTLAWILVAVQPNTDLLAKHLRQAGVEFAEQFEERKSDWELTTKEADT